VKTVMFIGKSMLTLGKESIRLEAFP
jgi:hypothetical protein